MLDVDKLAELNDDELVQTLELLASHRQYNKLDFFDPYPVQRDFYALGASKQERMLFAGNQMGKSYAGAGECAYHLTGLYPDWWTGRRWDRAVKAWAAGESTTVTRDVAQTLLCGEPGVDEAFGAGLIPRHLFADKPTLARGAVADAYDTVQVRHVSGGISTLQFKSYEQGRKKFQGRTLDFVWWDEEPPMDVYVEGNARWSATHGMSYMTFTPLQGMSDVVTRFLMPESTEDPDAVAMRGHLTMGIKDALHMSEEMQKSLLAKYPRHEWDARMNGVPLLGSGRVFVFDEQAIRWSRADVPVQWSKLGCLDFGISHPFAYVMIAWDRDDDIVYVLKTYRASDATPLIHCTAIRALGGGEVPVAWPHDGAKREAGSGKQLIEQYRLSDTRTYGLRCLPSHAHYPKGGYSTEAAVLELQQRFEKGAGPGGVRIDASLEDLFGELRMYHRKDGLLVKQNDDLISALFKGLMDKRHGKAMPVGTTAMRVAGQGARTRSSGSPRINPWTGRPEY